MGRESWMKDAACVGYDPEMWFPVGRTVTWEVRKAIEICRSCPVSLLCDQYRQRTRSGVGIWGGRWLRESPDGLTAPRDDIPGSRTRKQPERTIALTQ